MHKICFTISLLHASTCFEHMCSKHVEAWSKLFVKQTFYASSWLITEINILRCTVSKGKKKYSCQILVKLKTFSTDFPKTLQYQM